METTIKRTRKFNADKYLGSLSAKIEKEASERALAIAKDLVPVDTGELRASGELTEDGFEFTAGHAAAVEYGTEHQRAQPYVRPALAQVQKELLEIGKQEARSTNG